MRLVRPDDVEWEQISRHRKESPWFRRLLQGKRGALDNYEFALVRVEDRYDTPRHNHNFDQVRIMLDGSFDFGGQVQTEGTIGYFPAGTYYTQSARGPSTTLLLQIGAACRQGYLDFGQVREAAETLAAEGEFKDGLYHFTDASGQARTVDGYDAVFQRGAGFEASIPKPRFEGPILINPEAVDALPSDQGGSERFLGTFNEYGLTLSQRLGVDGTILTLRPRAGQKALLYLMTGGLQVRDGQHISRGTAIELARGDSIEATADGAVTLTQIDIPAFERAA